MLHVFFFCYQAVNTHQVSQSEDPSDIRQTNNSTSQDTTKTFTSKDMQCEEEKTPLNSQHNGGGSYPCTHENKICPVAVSFNLTNHKTSEDSDRSSV